MYKKISLLSKIFILFIILIFVGCSSNIETQRAAIKQAMNYDDKIMGYGIMVAFSNDAREKYVQRLSNVPLDNCPDDFIQAYKTHINAWEANDSNAIKSTWKKVESIAYKYGIAP